MEQERSKKSELANSTIIWLLSNGFKFVCSTISHVFSDVTAHKGKKRWSRRGEVSGPCNVMFHELLLRIQPPVFANFNGDHTLERSITSKERPLCVRVGNGCIFTWSLLVCTLQYTLIWPYRSKYSKKGPLQRKNIFLGGAIFYLSSFHLWTWRLHYFSAPHYYFYIGCIVYISTESDQ